MKALYALHTLTSPNYIFTLIILIKIHHAACKHRQSILPKDSRSSASQTCCPTKAQSMFTDCPSLPIMNFHDQTQEKTEPTVQSIMCDRQPKRQVTHIHRYIESPARLLVRMRCRKCGLYKTINLHCSMHVVYYTIGPVWCLAPCDRPLHRAGV